ncbi:nucleotidyl transferase AbiEii/AbiGii toxin family protein [Nonomuraea sp. NN258]|uniref:nucleotidyl transferase AbiEii/AbiGii toxin family protein n=1 Tax=Nonomuraea antri TaxID=2730852 RepID=UPI00156958EB|nr:nucleotidyl transferase AbiEii/AbiGii toxin family protein [Nonomuraea antri]NRQ39661.1 nucleotidyl transferase AbiEii/AbiGii toxin family protein [Nonomuraea antri]
MRFPDFQERLLAAVLPVCERYGLVLAGGHAMNAHGLADRLSPDLDFATATEPPLSAAIEGIARALRGAGLTASVAEATPRTGRLLVEDPATGHGCALHLLREALQRPPVSHEGLPVLDLEDAIGLKLRDLHERSLARDVIDVAAAAHLYSFRQLEHLARLHNDAFSLPELVMRLEFVELMDDEDFSADGIGAERIREIRRFAYAWVEDVKWRRADDGDADHDDPDLPALD